MLENKVLVIALPPHTSHDLQSLEVTVFGSYKPYLQQGLHRTAKNKKQLNIIDIATCSHTAYARSIISSTVKNGFVLRGLWDPGIRWTNIDALK